jgi:hypothetical protein
MRMLSMDETCAEGAAVHSGGLAYTGDGEDAGMVDGRTRVRMKALTLPECALGKCGMIPSRHVLLPWVQITRARLHLASSPRAPGDRIRRMGGKNRLEQRCGARGAGGYQAA